MRLPWLWAPARRQLLRIYLLGMDLIDLARRPLLHAVDANHLSFSDTSDRQRVHFARKERVCTILAFGQSNIANSGDIDGVHVPSSNVYNLNFLDGQMYQARDPLLGPTGYGANFLTRLARPSGARLRECRNCSDSPWGYINRRLVAPDAKLRVTPFGLPPATYSCGHSDRTHRHRGDCDFMAARRIRNALSQS